MGEEAARESALEALCRSYWKPVYEFARNWGLDEESAKDLTQAFFARLLEKNTFAQADQELGRFRTFLLTILKRFILDWEAYRQREKRGGDVTHLSIVCEDEPPLVEPADTPEQAFDRRWAMTQLERAATALRQEAETSGKAELFAALSPFLSGMAQPGDYERAGAACGLSRNAVAVTVFRLRARFRELLRREVAETLVHAADLETELQALREALRP